MFSQFQFRLCGLLLWTIILPFAAKTQAADNDAARAYLDRVESRIMAVWTLPEKVEGRQVILRMQLQSSGRVSNLRVEKSSGDKKFDASAVAAVRTASPFPAVPESAKFIVGDLHMVLNPTIPDSRAGAMRNKATDAKANSSSPR